MNCRLKALVGSNIISKKVIYAGVSGIWQE